MINTIKIKERMKSLNMSQKELAAHLNLKQPTLSQKLSGFRPLDVIEANKIVKILQIKESEISEYFFIS